MRLRHLLLASTALLAASPVFAGPEGAQVVGGSANVQGQGSANVTVNQFSQNAIINWHTFNIGAGERTQFVQPNASSVILNRVTGGLGPSQILGSIDANGKVMLINRDGFIFGAGAVINTGSFLATTSDIKNSDFMAGRYNFHIPGRPDASIVNMGTITAASGGFAALVAPGVRNSGTITATLGSVGLAAGNTFSLDMYGDRLITLGVNDQIAAEVKDVATGETLKSLVTNTGKLSANGGRVELTAAAARRVVDSVINTSGVIEANSVGMKNGRIVLGAATGSPGRDSAQQQGRKQTVRVSGTLSASGKQPGTKGGKIVITGENIEVRGATIDASGHDGGGKVLIGGDWGGGKPNTGLVSNQSAALEDEAIANATTVSVDAATRIDASAIVRGDGGKVVLWADDRMSFAGTIRALGGREFGNGGFAEVSGKKTLDYTGSADLLAPAGKAGTLLLDPEDFTVWSGIGPAPSGSHITNLALQLQLASGNVVIATNNSILAGNGDIFVTASVTWNAPTTLTMNAFRNIQINDNVTISNTGGGSLVARADSTGTGVGTIVFQQFTFGSRVNWTGSTGTVSFFYNPTSYTSPTDFTPTGQIGGGTRGVTTATPSQFKAYMLVNTATNLQNVSNNLAGTYALGKDINAVSIPNFAPIGSISSRFTGILEGQGHAISNLTIAPTLATTQNVGMFGVIGAGGIVRNLNITNASVTANPNVPPPGQFVGVLAGTNGGTIDNVTVVGTVSNGSVNNGVIAGGLVGQNGILGPGTSLGTINNAHASVNVTVGSSTTGSQNNNAGGLVGDNPGTITNSDAIGNVTGGGNSFIGGLVGRNETGATIDNSFATGSATLTGAGTGSGAGGLVGFNFGSITNSNATGAISGGSGEIFQAVGLGGLVGFNDADGTISNSHATGAVSGGTFAMAGGLVGSNNGAINNSHATGAVSTLDNFAGGLVGFNGFSGTINASFASGAISGSGFGLGGLVGSNAGTITASHATGNVTETGAFFEGSSLGGLVGSNFGAIAGSHATGNVTGGAASTAGGLVGISGGSIANSNASGNVTAGEGSIVGGLVGANIGQITNSFATGAVTADPSIAGGLAGMNAGTISHSWASGAVSGDDGSTLGGLVGMNVLGTISESFSTSNVTGTGTVFAGGLAGFNVGTITGSFATGAVTGGDGSFVGGLVAYNIGVPGFAPGTISQSYATGAVTGGAGSTVGGLAALNLGSLDQTYAAGLVTAGPGSTTGGLVALNNLNLSQEILNTLGIPGFGVAPGTATNSYWDRQTTGQNTSQGGTGKDTPDLTAALPAGFDPNAWSTAPGNYPFLTGQPNPLPVPGPPAPNNPQPPQPLPPVNPEVIPNIGQLAQATIVLQLANTTPQDPPKTEEPFKIEGSSSSGGSGGSGGRTGGGGANAGRPSVNSVPPAGLGPLPSGMPPLNETRFLSNEVVMQLGMNMSRTQVEELARRNGLEIIASEAFGLLGRTVYRFRITGGGEVRGIIGALQAIGATISAQPSYQFELTEAVAPSDTNRRGDSAQYIVTKLQLPEAHAIASGKNVKVAVIDSEIDGQHPDLQGVIAATYDALPSDDKTAHPHGTGMAGAIASHQRLLGVAPGAKLLAVRAFGVNTGGPQGTSMNIVKGLEWAVKEGAQVINMSFAGPRDPILEQAIRGLKDRGVILIAAAGNAGPKSPVLFPGGDPNVIAVSATDMDDKTYSNANRGKQVAIAAPGVDILVPAPEGGYQLTTGTSVAAAHISGVVALMLERNPRLTPAEVRGILAATAKKLPQGRNEVGAGLVDPVQALSKAAPKSAQLR